MQGYLFDLGYDEGAGEDTPAAGGEAVAPAPPAVSLADARPYQFGWRDAVRSGWLAGRSRLCGVAATGTGKTFGAGLIIKDVLDGVLDSLGRQRRALVIAHRGLLVRQLARELSILLPNNHVEIEMGDDRARGAADVVVACLDSLAIPRRLEWFRPYRYAAAVWDESHRYGAKNNKVRRIIQHFGDEFRHLGITATPDRSDGLSAFDDVVFEFDIYTAVEQGYLVKPYLAYEFSGDIRLEQLRLNKDGEFDADELTELMSSARPVAAVVAAARKWSGYNGGARPTIVTCAGIKHAERVAFMLNEWHHKEGTGLAAPIHSGMDEKEIDAAMKDFKAGRLRYLTHFDCLTEGFDSDLPKVLINGRPCKARWVFGQAAGRTLRPETSVARALAREPDPAARRNMIATSTKPGAMIVDVAGTGHRLSVDLLDVFRPREADDGWVDTVRQRSIDRAKAGSAADPMKEYEEQRAKYAALRAAKRLEEEARWHGVLVTAPLQTKMEDPFEKAVTVGREPPWLLGKRPTTKMRQALLKAGIPREAVEGYTFSQAKRQIDVIVDRRKRGLCTYKQLSTLKRFGVDASTMTFEEAGAELDRLAKSNWKAGTA
jgi:superfamily II DNA or RNA helicase